MNKHIRIAAAVLLAALVAVPVFAARGSADFSRFVFIGDSTGAGYGSASLNERHQQWSVAAIIARQAGLNLCPPTATAADPCFAQPLVSFPGYGNELVLNSLVPSTVIAPAPGQAAPLMPGFARPYNNLSIPGATLGATLMLTGGEQPRPGEPGAVSMARLILRGLGTTVQQVAAYKPTFIGVWIGNNDALNTVFSGTPATLTPVADFEMGYEALLDSLIAASPQAGMVVGTIPSSILPYVSLVPPVLIDPTTRQPVLVNGQPVYFMVDIGNGQQAPIAPTTLIPLHVRAKLAQGYGLPPQFRFVPPFSSLPHVGEPLSPNDVITQEELQQVLTRIGEYNNIIRTAAAERNIPVADTAGAWARAHAGQHLGPITISGAPVTGGFYSFDFIHPTDLGYLLLANEFIRAINGGYDTEIPVAAIWQLFQNNGAFFGENGPGPNAQSLVFLGRNNGITDEGLAQIVSMFWQTQSTKRLRSVGR